MQGSGRTVCCAFVTLAIGTGGNVTFLKVFSHVGPEVGQAEEVVSLREAEVAKRVMRNAEKFLLNATVCKDNQTVMDKDLALRQCDQV